MMIDWLRSASHAPPGTVKRVMSRQVVDHLIRDERVLMSTRHHPVVAVWPLPMSFVALMLVVALTARLPDGNPLIDVLWWGWLASLGYAGWRLLEWSNEIFVVTDRRVMLFSGFITRHIAMMPLVKVTDLTYRRTLGGRLLGYGELIIESAGQDQALHAVRFLPNPGELYHDIAGTLFGRGGDRAAENRPRKIGSDAAEQLQPRPAPAARERDPTRPTRPSPSAGASDAATVTRPRAEQDDTAALDAIDD